MVLRVVGIGARSRYCKSREMVVRVVKVVVAMLSLIV